MSLIKEILSNINNKVLVNTGISKIFKSLILKFLDYWKIILFILFIFVFLYILFFYIYINFFKKDNISTKINPYIYNKDPTYVVKTQKVSKEYTNRYINAYINGPKYNVFSSVSNSIDIYEKLGTKISTFSDNRNFEFFLPIKNENILFFGQPESLNLRGNRLGVYFETPIKNKKEEITGYNEIYKIIGPNTNYSLSDINNLQITLEGNISFELFSNFFVYDNLGNKLAQVKINPDDGALYTFYNNEIYFVKNTSSFKDRIIEYSLVNYQDSQNSSFSLKLGSLKPSKIYVVNAEKVLIVEEVSKSKFRIRLLDSNGSNIFSFIPKENDTELEKIDLALYNPVTTDILLIGNGIAKLFNKHGEEIWAN